MSSAPAARGGLTRSHETLLLVAAAACLWLPYRTWVSGGAASPAALARDLTGRAYVVTGATAGIGFETARHLCSAGAAVVLGARDAARGQAAAERLRARSPRGCAVTVLPL